KKRDHRILGKQLRLFTISQAVGSGLILWMPRGATVRGLLETFIKEELLKRGYQPVYTPHIGRLELYRTSGHFPYYRDAQFPPMYFNAIAGAVDLAQYRLAAGHLDDKKEQAFRELLDLAEYKVLADEYDKAATDEERLATVRRIISQLLDAVGIDVPGFRAAPTPADAARALLHWLEQKEG